LETTDLFAPRQKFKVVAGFLAVFFQKFEKKSQNVTVRESQLYKKISKKNLLPPGTLS